MDPRLITPPPAGSPWSSWARPDIHHCEASLGGWIAAPSDTWSNLAYFVVGAWLLNRRGPERSLGFIALTVGACSFAFHASYTYQGQVLDYAAMFLLTSWLLARGAVRAGVLDESSTTPAWAVLVGLSVSLFAVFRAFRLPVQTIMMGHIAATMAQEARLWKTGRAAPSYAAFGAAAGLIAAAYACWQLDHTDRFCRPDDHVFQWHAVWHVLTAAAFVPLARFQLLAAAGRDGK